MDNGMLIHLEHGPQHGKAIGPLHPKGIKLGLVVDSDFSHYFNTRIRLEGQVEGAGRRSRIRILSGAGNSTWVITLPVQNVVSRR